MKILEDNLKEIYDIALSFAGGTACANFVTNKVKGCEKSPDDFTFWLCNSLGFPTSVSKRIERLYAEYASVKAYESLVEHSKTINDLAIIEDKASKDNTIRDNAYGEVLRMTTTKYVELANGTHIDSF